MEPAAALPISPSHRADPRRLGWFLIVAAILIAVAVGRYFVGLMGAVVLATITAPVQKRLARRLPSRFSAAMLSVGVLALIMVPAAWLLVTAMVEAAAALGRLQQSGVASWLASLRFAGIDLGGQVATLTGSLLSWLSGQAFAFLGNATTAVINLVFALFGMYYLLAGSPELWLRLRARLPFDSMVAERLRARFVAVTEAMLLGTLLTAVLQGALVGVAFAVVGLRGAVLWGVVTACVSILPVMGSAFVWLPATALLVAQHRLGAAVAMLVMGGGLAANLDNVIRLVVYRRVSNVHPMITLVGGFAGFGVFGILGVLVGPLLLLYFFELLRAYDEALATTE